MTTESERGDIGLRRHRVGKEKNRKEKKKKEKKKKERKGKTRLIVITQ
jgi:hypothetical protein